MPRVGVMPAGRYGQHSGASIAIEDKEELVTKRKKKTKEPAKLHIQTWMREGDTMRRVGAKESLSLEDFEEQRRTDVEYVILERSTGTMSGATPKPAYTRVD